MFEKTYYFYMTSTIRVIQNEVWDSLVVHFFRSVFFLPKESSESISDGLRIITRWRIRLLHVHRISVPSLRVLGIII